MATPSLSPILIAEDDPNDLFLVQRHLSRAGVRHPLLTFVNGEELVDFLATKCVEAEEFDRVRPRLLFLDIKMPRRDGFEALRWIRQQAVLGDLNVVVLSGSDEPKDIARAKELGANRFLTKYPAPEVFAEMVATFT